MSRSKKNAKRPAKEPKAPSETLRNDKQAKAAGPKFDKATGTWKPRRLVVGDGLALHVMPGPKIDGNVTTGGKWWRFRYRYGGREKMLSLGTYPDVSLKAARAARDEARRDLHERNIDPSAKRRAERAAQADSFEAVALEWLATGCKPNRKGTPSPGTVAQIRGRLEREVFPRLRSRPVSQVERHELERIVKAIQESGRGQTAYRVANYMNRLFTWAMLTERVSANPAAYLSLSLEQSSTQHFASVVDVEERARAAAVGRLLRAIDGYQGQPSVVAALKIAAYAFPGRPSCAWRAGPSSTWTGQSGGSPPSA